MQQTHEESDYQITNQMVTGHFHQSNKYSVWRTHGTEDWLLIYTISGRGRFGFADGELTLEAHDAVLIRPRTLHDYGVASHQDHWELLWSHFAPLPSWRGWLNWPEAAPGLMHLSFAEPIVRKKIVDRLLDMHRLATGALRHREQFAMNALEEVLLWCDTQNPRSEQMKLDPRVQKAMAYLCENLNQAMNLDDLVPISTLSVSRLSHLFREQVGVTPPQFLEDQRMRRAQQLLELTSYPIQTIALEVGFENPFYFTLRFKKYAGVSPSDYRKRLHD